MKVQEVLRRCEGEIRDVTTRERKEKSKLQREIETIQQ